MNIVDEFILQRFPNLEEEGKVETDKPYQARLKWHRLNYPSAEELSENCSSSVATIHKYSSRFGWKDIKKRAIDLQEEQDQIELRERQAKIEEKHRTRNEKLGKANEEYLDSLLDKLEAEGDSLSKDELYLLMCEIRATRKELSSIQRDERTTEHLPNAYKDTTPDELKINQEGKLRLEHHHENKVSELLDYEDYFKKLDARAEELPETDSSQE